MNIYVQLLVSTSAKDCAFTFEMSVWAEGLKCLRFTRYANLLKSWDTNVAIR